MNERFRQLYEQAHIERRQEYFSSVVDPTIKSVSVTRHFDLDLFAELIVQECLAIAKNREDELESAGLLSESNAVGNVAYRISRQFGVKR